MALVNYKELAGINDAIRATKEQLTKLGDKLETDYEASGNQRLIKLIDGIFAARDCLKEAEGLISDL